MKASGRSTRRRSPRSPAKPRTSSANCSRKIPSEDHGLRPMSHLRFYRAILSRDFIARSSRSVRLCSCTRRTNQTNMTDYDTLGSSLVLVGCLAKRKCTINRRLQKRSDMEQFRHFGSVFVKEDRETGKVVQKPCLFTRQSRRVQLDSRSV